MAYRPKTTKERILHRAKIARGHLNKIIEMIEQDAYCIDIVNQSRAVQRALHEVDALTLKEHLNGCVAGSLKKGKPDEVISELITLFQFNRYD